MVDILPDDALFHENFRARFTNEILRNLRGFFAFRDLRLREKELALKVRSCCPVVSKRAESAVFLLFAKPNHRRKPRKKSYFCIFLETNPHKYVFK